MDFGCQSGAAAGVVCVHEMGREKERDREFNKTLGDSKRWAFILHHWHLQLMVSAQIQRYRKQHNSLNSNRRKGRLLLSLPEQAVRLNLCLTIQNVIKCTKLGMAVVLPLTHRQEIGATKRGDGLLKVVEQRRLGVGTSMGWSLKVKGIWPLLNRKKLQKREHKLFPI